MKKLLCIPAFVLVVAAIQLLTPVQVAHADTCSVIDHADCDTYCANATPGSCVLTGVTCAGGVHVTCGCDMFCLYPGHDPNTQPGGFRHIAIVDGEAN